MSAVTRTKTRHAASAGPCSSVPFGISVNGWHLAVRPVQHRKSRKQTSEARCAQWNERLCGLPALPLQYSHSVVTDAIDRKHRAIGSTDEARQKCHAVLDSTIVIEQSAAGAFHDGLELRHLMSPAADVKHLRAAELRDGGFEVFRKPATNLLLDECQLAAKPFAFALGDLPSAFGLRLREHRGLKTAFEALAASNFPVQATFEVDQCLLGGTGIVVRVLGQNRRLRQRPAQRLVEETDLIVTRGEAIAQLALLRFKLGRQRGVFFLKPA